METSIFCFLPEGVFSSLIFAYILNTSIILFFSFFLRGKLRKLGISGKVVGSNNLKISDLMLMIIPSIFIGVVNSIYFATPIYESPLGSFSGILFVFLLSTLFSLLVISIFFSEQPRVSALLVFAYIILLFGILIPPFLFEFSVIEMIIVLILAIIVAKISYKIGVKYQKKLNENIIIEIESTSGNDEILTKGFKKAQKTIMENGSPI